MNVPNLQSLIKTQNARFQTTQPKPEFTPSEVTLMQNAAGKWRHRFGNIGFSGRDAIMLAFFRSPEFKTLCQSRGLIEKIIAAESHLGQLEGTVYPRMQSNDRSMTFGSILKFGLPMVASTDYLRLGTENVDKGIGIDAPSADLARLALAAERESRYYINTLPGLQAMADQFGIRDEFEQDTPLPEWKSNLSARWNAISSHLLSSNDSTRGQVIDVLNYSNSSMIDQAHWWMRDTFGGKDSANQVLVSRFFQEQKPDAGSLKETYAESCEVPTKYANLDALTDHFLDNHLLLDEWFGHMMTDRAHLESLVFAEYPEYTFSDGSKYKMRDVIGALCTKVQADPKRYEKAAEQLNLRLGRVEDHLAKDFSYRPEVPSLTAPMAAPYLAATAPLAQPTAMPVVTQFSKDLLSDHAYQSTRFDDVQRINGQERTLSTVSIGSWNLQDKCVSKATNLAKTGNEYANSPFPDYDETINEYKIRKNAQIDQILEKIRAGEDIILLQEVDFLFPSTYQGSKMSSDDKELRGAQEVLKARLERELNDTNRTGGRLFEISLSSKDTGGTSNQKMATIYDARRFTLRSVEGVLATEMGKGKGRMQHRGCETTFKDNLTGKPFIATNLHLKFGADYKESISAYQQSKKGVFSVMGGDTNNVQNENLETALGDWNHATNFSQGDDGRLTTSHNIPGYQKSFDRFFAGPSAGSIVRACPNIGRSEEIKMHEGQPRFVPIQSARPSESRVGEHWRRGSDIIKELVEEYKQASTVQNKETCLLEMSQVIKSKGLDVNKYLTDKDIKSAYLRRYPTDIASMAAPQGPAAAPIIAAAAQPPSSPPQTQQGGLIPFRVDFLDSTGNGISKRQQAITILTEVERLHQAGVKKVGITYSANVDQTNEILATYQRGEWETGTNGSNQARVIHEIEVLLKTDKYKHLQSVYQTVPITTMSYQNEQLMAATPDEVMISIKNANALITSGVVILGWRHQSTQEGKLAIGEGVSDGIQGDFQKRMIDDWVRNRLSESSTLNLGVAAHAPETKPSKAQNYDLGYGNVVTGITPIDGGGFIITGQNTKGEEQPIQVHADGSIHDSATTPNFIFQAIKHQINEIFSHFKITLPTPTPTPTPIPIKNTYAKGQSDSADSFHLFAANDFKNRLSNLRGDHLKRTILESFKERIQMTTSKDDLKKLTDNLKKLPDYNVLQTGQSLFTKITGIKTSSIQALEDMIKQKEESFDSKLKPK